MNVHSQETEQVHQTKLQTLRKYIQKSIILYLECLVQTQEEMEGGWDVGYACGLNKQNWLPPRAIFTPVFSLLSPACSNGLR